MVPKFGFAGSSPTCGELFLSKKEQGIRKRGVKLFTLFWISRLSLWAKRAVLRTDSTNIMDPVVGREYPFPLPSNLTRGGTLRKLSSIHGPSRVLQVAERIQIVPLTLTTLLRQTQNKADNEPPDLHKEIV